MRSNGVVDRINRALGGQTQAWLSAQTGISQRTISYWMRGRCKPSLESIEKVAAALGVPPGWLAFGEDGS